MSSLVFGNNMSLGVFDRMFSKYIPHHFWSAKMWPQTFLNPDSNLVKHQSSIHKINPQSCIAEVNIPKSAKLEASNGDKLGTTCNRQMRTKTWSAYKEKKELCSRKTNPVHTIISC